MTTGFPASSLRPRYQGLDESLFVLKSSPFCQQTVGIPNTPQEAPLEDALTIPVSVPTKSPPLVLPNQILEMDGGASISIKQMVIWANHRLQFVAEVPMDPHRTGNANIVGLGILVPYTRDPQDAPLGSYRRGTSTFGRKCANGIGPWGPTK